MKTGARAGSWLGGNKFRCILKLDQLCILMDVVGIERERPALSGAGFWKQS